MREKIKEIWNVISAFIGVGFAIYAFICTVTITAQLLAEYWKFQGIGVISLILVSALTYITYKKFSE